MAGIRILITGGTFDKIYDERSGALDFKETHVPDMLKVARCTRPAIAYETLFLKDSLELNEEDRIRIGKVCLISDERRIVITHGTDTIHTTAQYLSGLPLNGKTIVLAGAMIPYSFGASDALFNLGCAIVAVQTLQPNVYITMNGEVFSSNGFSKDKEQAAFVRE